MTVKEMMALLDATLAATARFTIACTAGHGTPWRLASSNRPRDCCPPTGWATAGPRTGPAWSRPPALDRTLATHDAQWVLGSAEQFYVSLGFPRLPESFWRASDLLPVPATGPRKKNAQASAWHIDHERTCDR